MPCLLHDHVYRMGVAWQNVAYNQPPHLGYYLPDRVFVVGTSGIETVRGEGRGAQAGAVEVYSVTGRRLTDVEADALPTGIYIIRRGGQTRKVVVR